MWTVYFREVPYANWKEHSRWTSFEIAYAEILQLRDRGFSAIVGAF